LQRYGNIHHLLPQRGAVAGKLAGISCQRHGYFRPIGMIVHLVGCFTGVTNHLARRQYYGDAGGGLLADFLADCIHFSSIQGCQVGDDLFLDCFSIF